MEINHKLAVSQSAAVPDPIIYRRLVGQLIYLTVKRPDISYSVHILSQFLANPTVDHMSAAYKVLRYLKNAPAQGLFYTANQPLLLSAYCDSDWAACPLSRRSISGFSVLLGSSLVSWKSKKQVVISRSSAEAEYRAMAHVCCELVWIHRLLADFLIAFPLPISLFCDNAAAIHISRNPVFHERTKHVELDCHLVRQHFSSGFIAPQFVRTEDQAADIFTKPLGSANLQRLCSKLNMSNFLHTLGLRGGIEAAETNPITDQMAAG